MTELLLMNGSRGLNNNDSPYKLPQVESGATYLTACSNVYVEDNGRITNLFGLDQQFDLPGAHSLFCYAGRVLFYFDGALRTVEDGLVVSITTVLDKPVCWCAVETGDHIDVYWSNGVELGIIRDFSANRSWSLSTYQPIPDTRVYASAMPGHLIVEWYGVMAIAYDNHIFYSVGGDPTRFILNERRLSYGSKIRMLAPFQTGLWVSDERKIWWVERREILVQVEKTNYPAFLGNPVKVPLTKLPFQGMTGTGYIALTPEGFVLLTDSGTLLNLTERVLVLKNSLNQPLNILSYSAALLDNRIYLTAEEQTAGSGGGTVTCNVYAFTDGGTVTLTSEHIGALIIINSASATTVVMPQLVNAPYQDETKIVKMGAGAVTVNAYSGETIATTYGEGTSIQEASTNLYSYIELEKLTTTKWFGEIMGNWDLL